MHTTNLAAKAPGSQGVLNPARATGFKPHIKWLNGAVLTVYTVVVFSTAMHHEPWADEAQAWLLARDLGWFHLIFYELRYEGIPGLWHTLLWLAIHLFRAPYPALGWISATGAVLGTAVLLFLAPFPRPLRYVIPFSFFFVYQYAVIARPYTLLPLLGFMAAFLYRRGEAHVLLFAIVLVLLANVSVHGTLIASTLGLAYAWRARQSWPKLDEHARKRHLIAAAVFLGAILFLAAVLYPPANTVAMADASSLSFTEHLEKCFAMVREAFSDSPIVSLFTFLALGFWCFGRQGLLLYALALLPTILLTGFIRGDVHHEGILLIAALVVLWILWPDQQELRTSRRMFHTTSALAIGLCLLFVYQLSWSYYSIRNDWTLPYSGAKDAAAFLKGTGAEKELIYGYGYWAVGVLPYFNTNIFANWRHYQPGAYFHNSTYYRMHIFPSSLTFELGKPKYVVLATSQTLESDRSEEGFFPAIWRDYDLLHVSDGIMFFKKTFVAKQTYFIFRRRQKLSSPSP